MTELGKNMIDYFVICVNEFAKQHDISKKDSMLYLDKYGGLDFLEEFYDVQHTLPFEDTVNSLTIICRKNGGTLS